MHLIVGQESVARQRRPRWKVAPAIRYYRGVTVMPNDIQALPPDLPVPIDDGACAHLQGAAVPPIRLKSSTRRVIDVSELRGTVVMYVFPRITAADRPVPDGWDQIPGARGCTPQSCRFRDLHQEFSSRGIQVFGVSTQSPSYQHDAAERLRLPFELLSDEQLELTHGWALPTFTVDGEVLLKRLTLVVRDGTVAKVFYPVFPPTSNADDVLAWLASQKAAPAGLRATAE
jgi:peroxiredoxin